MTSSAVVVEKLRMRMSPTSSRALVVSEKVAAHLLRDRVRSLGV